MYTDIFLSRENPTTQIYMKRIFSFLFFAESQNLPLKFEEIWKKSKYPGEIQTSIRSGERPFGQGPNLLSHGGIAWKSVSICHNVY